jgi:thiol-disulfide isomerase/thioredoxin
VVTLQETGPLEKGDAHDPEKVLAFLVAQQTPPLDAEVVLKEAIDRASHEQKLVFVHLGAPWCGWCHKLEKFFARPEIAEIVALDYVRVKIDVDRMTNGEAVHRRFRKEAKGGIPWFWFMKPTGEVLATSDGKGGNIGHPYQPEEIAHFMEMVKKTATKATAEQWKTVEAALLRQMDADAQSGRAGR